MIRFAVCVCVVLACSVLVPNSHLNGKDLSGERRSTLGVEHSEAWDPARISDGDGPDWTRQQTPPPSDTTIADSTALDPPSNLATSVIGDTVRLSWVVPDTAAVAEYRIYRGTASIDSLDRPADSLLRATLPADTIGADTTGLADTTAFIDTSGVQGETYYYRLTAVDSSGTASALSGMVAAKVPPGPSSDSDPPPSSLLVRTFSWIGGLPWWGQMGGGAIGLFLLYGLVAYMRRQRQDSETEERPSYEIRLPGGTLQIGNVQHVGGRSEQQDAFGFSDPSRPETIEQKGLLSIVADGMGGMEKGAAASNAAIQSMIGAHDDWDGEEAVPEWMRRAVGTANRAVLEVAEGAGLEGEVGTTLSAVLIYDNSIHWVSVGDSRVYLFREGELAQLTDDHVYARELQEQVREGEISAEEAAQHPERGALTSYLGMTKLKYINQNQRPLGLQDGDQLMICSDGLYNGLEEEQIQAALQLSSQEACEALVQQVLGDAGEHQDNLTVMVLEYEQDDDLHQADQ